VQWCYKSNEKNRFFLLPLSKGFLNAIPNFGPLIALIPAVLIALMQSPEMALIIVCVYTFIQIIQSAIVQPIIQYKMINIPPALTIVAQLGMGLFAGLWGVLLAVPVLVISMVVVEELYLKRRAKE